MALASKSGGSMGRQSSTGVGVGLRADPVGLVGPHQQRVVEATAGEAKGLGGLARWMNRG